MLSRETFVALLVVGVFLGSMIVFHKKKRSVSFSGGDEVIQDLCVLARQQSLEFLGGRSHEIARIVHILLRRTKNNPLLLGHPGVGKTAIVHGLAQRMVRGDVPPRVAQKTIFALDLPGLLAGSHLRGELERRVRDLFSRLERKERDVILFIDEVHMLDQAKGSQGGLNITDMIKPALARGELQVIGATTWKEYQETILQDPALARRFQPVIVDEPDEATAQEMLDAVRPSFEAFHGVEIPYEVLGHAVRSSRLITSRYLPDKAIDLIDEAAAKVSLAAVVPEHLASMGMLHGAAKKTLARSSQETPQVTLADVDAVLADWVGHEEQL